jgi:hypothetical protein
MRFDLRDVGLVDVVRPGDQRPREVRRSSNGGGRGGNVGLPTTFGERRQAPLSREALALQGR